MSSGTLFIGSFAALSILGVSTLLRHRLIAGFYRYLTSFFLCMVLLSATSISFTALSLDTVASGLPAALATTDTTAPSLNSTGFVESQFVAGLSNPTSMEFSPDSRLFVAEQDGSLHVIKNGTLLDEPFLHVNVTNFDERGLIGVTFDPEFEENGHLYVYYTTSSDPIHNRVSRFTANASNPDVAAAGSEEILLELENLGSTNLNGGALHFGSDGKLYIGVGTNNQEPDAQSLSSLLGKILRINPDGSAPPDNPFFNVTGARKEIWALGLRNPFSFAFRANTTTMYINDVGSSSMEEINLGRRAANYGWPECEGPCQSPRPDFTEPLFAYEHPEGGSSAIAGSAFYEATQFPSEYRGSYFFGDFVESFIKRLTPENEAADFLANARTPVDIDVGPDGSLYYLSYADGTVRRVSYGAESTESTVSEPVMKDTEDNTLSTARTGQRVVLSTTVVNSNSTESEMQFLTLIEARASDGVTHFLDWQVDTLRAGGAAEIELTWTPAVPGDYQLRTFAISDLEKPRVLTDVRTSDVVISNR